MYTYLFATKFAKFVSVVLSVATQVSLDPTEEFSYSENSESVIACRDQLAATMISFLPSDNPFVGGDKSDTSATCVYIDLSLTDIQYLTNRVKQSGLKVLSVSYNDSEIGVVYLPWPLIIKPDKID